MDLVAAASNQCMLADSLIYEAHAVLLGLKLGESLRARKLILE